ncbi:MAG: 3-phosphoshikimate 1-carboxyvinyltransferase [Dehalococcoidia bacterium]|nr:3-phosphoshikimate 1-carboxyvinyltransferase [Dehalococcoidia bacterium]
MRVTISQSMISGSIQAPSSKSYTLRALMCAALADGLSEIESPLYADDTEAGREALGKIGVAISEKDGSWLVSGGSFRQPDSELFCRDSAGTLRFMTAICSLVPGICRLTAGLSLSRRPIAPLVEALRLLGVDCTTDGSAAVTIRGDLLKGGTAGLPGDISSQLVSALLFIAPRAEEGMSIELAPPVESKPYIDMTIDCMKKFGIRVGRSSDDMVFEIKPQAYRPARYRVEGDWSSASYLLALGAVAGDVHVFNLNRSSLQADREILTLLKRMGADLQVRGDGVRARKARLKAVKADLSDCIDLLPTMAVLAAAAQGESILSGISRARLKESDRVAAVKEGLQRMGIPVREERDSMYITGGRPAGCAIDAKGDHRIAMAFSIPGVLAGNTVIEDAECVTKTYPDFWAGLKGLGGEVVFDEQ